MPRQQNLGESELISDTSDDYALSKQARRPLKESAPVEAVPHVLKRKAHQRFLKNWSQRRRGIFNTIGPNRTWRDVRQESVMRVSGHGEACQKATVHVRPLPAQSGATGRGRAAVILLTRNRIEVPADNIGTICFEAL